MSAHVGPLADAGLCLQLLSTCSLKEIHEAGKAVSFVLLAFHRISLGFGSIDGATVLLPESCLESPHPPSRFPLLDVNSRHSSKVLNDFLRKFSETSYTIGEMP